MEDEDARPVAGVVEGRRLENRNAVDAEHREIGVLRLGHQPLVFRVRDARENHVVRAEIRARQKTSCPFTRMQKRLPSLRCLRSMSMVRSPMLNRRTS